MALTVATIALFAALPSTFVTAEEGGTVHPDAESVVPLRPGAAVPSVGVRDLDGNRVDLASLVGDRGALLVFYRGGW